VVIGYALLSLAIWFAATHGLFDLHGSLGRAAKILLGPFNLLVIAADDSRAGRGLLPYFFFFSLPLLPALVGSFGRSGCLRSLCRAAVLGIWVVADFWAWVVGIPLE
jgi:hypothetical protein